MPAAPLFNQERYMRLFNAKYSLLTWVSLILVAGFLATSVAGYVASRDAIEHGIADQALPLTGDNIYSEIQKDILRPVFISSLMAHDTFVRDWILSGEKNPEQLIRYLNEVKKKYGTVSSFLISNRSYQYYHAAGTLKAVREDEPRDAWFFRVRAMREDYETNVDLDLANRDSMTIFINHRVLDYDGKFIGATGVGLTLDTMSHILDRYRSRFHRTIYFVDTRGDIVLAGKEMRQARHDSIHNMAGVRDIATQILNGDDKPTRLAYRNGAANVMVNSRFITELNWYLVVEQNVSDEVKPLQRVFMLNLAISFAVTLLVLGLTLTTVRRYQRRLERLAATDALTGLLNRQALETIFRNAILTSKRNGKPLAAILFDIDYFKRVNDAHGHLQGDQVIRAVADLARAAVRESDVVTRWGGEEYLILLNDCALDQAAQIGETLRAAVAAHDFGLPGAGSAGAGSPLTISLGVAEFRQQETETAFFARADSALYQAKDAGRNRLQKAQ